jgi:trehalose 2-sulfotransferase
LVSLLNRFFYPEARQDLGDNWHPHLGQVGGKALRELMQAFPPTAQPVTTIILATLERTGSEWLCELMGRTGVLGRPSEYLNTHWMRKFVSDYPEDVQEQAELAKQLGVTSNGCLSVKLHPWHFDRLSAETKLSEVFPNPKFVFIVREDCLGQAISLVRARQTEKFHSYTKEARTPEFDSGEIYKTLSEITTGQARWNTFFFRNGLNPLRLTYEDLNRDPGKVLSEIGRYAGIKIPTKSAKEKTGLRVQRDGLSGEWRRRFLAETKNIDLLDHLA